MGADLFGFEAAPQVDGEVCLGCGGHHPGAREVTLVSGQVVSSYSEAWRLECQARSILGKSPQAVRQGMLRGIERRHGKAASDQLRDVMADIWNARMAAKSAAA